MAAQDIKQSPWAAVSPWMVDDLKLKGDRLMVFALLYERDVRPTQESDRINADYIAAASGLDPKDLFDVVSTLKTKDHLLDVDFSSTAGGLLAGFRASAELVEARLGDRDGDPRGE